METLYDAKIRAHLGLGQDALARQTMSEGLAACPGSAYLSRHLEVLTDQELLAHGDEPTSGSQVEG